MTKINSLSIENVKRVKAVQIEPTQNGLTVIGGKNDQGKTSVLDAITWALGGNKFKPSKAKNDNSVTPPQIKIELDNGLIVERKGKNSDLKVTDPSGNKAGQNLLDSFVSEFALDLPRFMEATPKEKANILLNIIGVGDQLYEMEKEEETLYNQRTAIGQIADQKKKFAQEMTIYPDVPIEPVSASTLIQEQQAILLRNAENQKKREQVDRISRTISTTEKELAHAQEQLERWVTEVERIKGDLVELETDLETARRSAKDLQDESTEELEKSIDDIDDINRKIRANLDREKADEDAADYKAKYDDLTEQINKVREDRMALLDGAELPLKGLSVEDGALTFEGFKWDGLSGSKRLKVATAIVRKLNPNCGFVLIDKLEQMDTDTLKEFGEWLEGEGLQAIATRVSTGEECTILIEDGYSKSNIATPKENKWKAGQY
jgi:predicted ATP-dependent endonuclease of OLD family